MCLELCIQQYIHSCKEYVTESKWEKSIRVFRERYVCEMKKIDNWIWLK